MIEQLPDLYRTAAINPFTEEQLEKRSKSINTIIGKRKMDWLLDCVRLYLSKPIDNPEFLDEFIKAFKDDDPLFYDGDQQLELRTLAGAIIREYLRKKKSENRAAIALAVISGHFGIPDSSIDNILIVKEAMMFIENDSFEKRNSAESDDLKIPEVIGFDVASTDIATVNTNLKKIGNSIQEFVIAVKKSNEFLFERCRVLEEESNIHWWLFRGQSSTAKVPFDELPKNIAPFIFAWELYELTTIIPGPNNSIEFLKKSFSTITGLDKSKVTIGAAVDELYKSMNSLLGKVDNLNYFGNLTPLLFGFNKAVDCGGHVGWKDAFTHSTRLNSSFDSTALNFSHQLYIELSLTWC